MFDLAILPVVFMPLPLFAITVCWMALQLLEEHSGLTTALSFCF